MADAPTAAPSAAPATPERPQTAPTQMPKLIPPEVRAFLDKLTGKTPPDPSALDAAEVQKVLALVKDLSPEHFEIVKQAVHAYMERYRERLSAQDTVHQRMALDTLRSKLEQTKIGKGAEWVGGKAQEGLENVQRSYTEVPWKETWENAKKLYDKMFDGSLWLVEKGLGVVGIDAVNPDGYWQQKIRPPLKAFMKLALPVVALPFVFKKLFSIVTGYFKQFGHPMENWKGIVGVPLVASVIKPILDYFSGSLAKPVETPQTQAREQGQVVAKPAWAQGNAAAAQPPVPAVPSASGGGVTQPLAPVPASAPVPSKDVPSPAAAGPERLPWEQCMVLTKRNGETVLAVRERDGAPVRYFRLNAIVKNTLLSGNNAGDEVWNIASLINAEGLMKNNHDGGMTVPLHLDLSHPRMEEGAKKLGLRYVGVLANIPTAVRPACTQPAVESACKAVIQKYLNERVHARVSLPLPAVQDMLQRAITSNPAQQTLDVPPMGQEGFPLTARLTQSVEDDPVVKALISAFTMSCMQLPHVKEESEGRGWLGSLVSGASAFAKLHAVLRGEEQQVPLRLRLECVA
ncbi:hypothetical protein COU80_03585 [Candidatus Peregrinibacteria bacterium CG10_big_fil_rev_8_21_14_0_10_55_24]|nr:MAG: hypothetical protein COU80_03585 [Candidatus Peregrinibacteria bacterium CG10_big_fil_rev_8_21_14_0_10_55_24]